MTDYDSVARTLAVLELARDGRFGDIREMFAVELRGLVTADGLRTAWTAEAARLGEITGVGTPIAEPAGPGVTVVRVPVTGAGGSVTLLAAMNSTGALTALQLTPDRPDDAWAPPPYADREAFAEQEVTVGTGPLAVRGTLTLPKRGGRWPGVVMLSGSGPNDRDSTIGPNKPFKDLAWGLAGHGIAVLRFDKVTHAHRDELRAAEAFTLTDEYVPDGVAAVALLRAYASRVFVLGHSLGGTAAPRVAAAEPSVAGLVILAGGAQPLHRSAERQVRYIISLRDGSLRDDPDPADQATIDSFARQADRVDSGDLSPTTPASELPFGVAAPYWLDLRSYDPVAAAAALGRPMLVLQGGRDYQATVADDLALWRSGLAGQHDVTFRVYEADNHLFGAGDGRCRPEEYAQPSHVDPVVVADIAEWLIRHESPPDVDASA